jgi:hypothetical protein
MLAGRVPVNGGSRVRRTPNSFDFGCTCYHPLFVFNQLGDLERCVLRAGNVHSVNGWRDVLQQVIGRYRDKVKRRYHSLNTPGISA